MGEGPPRATNRTAAEDAAWDPVAFVAEAVRELSEPIAALALLTETVAQHLDHLTHDQLRGAVASAAERAVHLRRGLRDVLEATRVERLAAGAELGPVRLLDVVTAALAAAPPPTSLEVTTSVPGSLRVLAHRSGLEEALVALLENAYAYGGNRLSIAGAGDGSRALLVLADDGPGVPAFCVDRVFEPFVRGHTDGKGAGIGLAIARAQVQGMGGSLEYRPGTPRGNRFIARLRVASSRPVTSLSRTGGRP